MRLLALLAAFVAFQVFWFTRETPTERRLGEIAAATIVGRDAEVRCPSIWSRLIDISGAAGRARVDEHGNGFAILTDELCEAYDRVFEEGFPDDVSCLAERGYACDESIYVLATAIHVLAHEAYHLAGNVDEAVTNCYAFQANDDVARAVGATDDQAVFLAAYLIATTGGPDRYFSVECRPGGELDLHPATPDWPAA